MIILKAIVIALLGALLLIGFIFTLVVLGFLRNMVNGDDVTDDGDEL